MLGMQQGGRVFMWVTGILLLQDRQNKNIGSMGKTIKMGGTVGESNGTSECYT